MEGTGGSEGHPDEGLIHAWLDEALDAAESERLSAHVRECPACQERVAEARGLIAGASRIVAALDEVPAGSRPGWAQNAVSDATVVGGARVVDDAKALPERSLWRWLRVTPGRAALAATILVALGITLTRERMADESVRPASAVFNPQRADAPALDSSGDGAGGAGLAKSEKVAARDPLLDSAVARNLAMAQGRRVLKAAPGQPLPQAPPVPASAAPADLDSRAVVEGRAESQARRELTGAFAGDRARVGVARDEAAPTTGAVAGVSRADLSSAASPTADAAEMAPQVGNAVGRTCLRLESSEPGASWGEQPFPMVMAIDPGPVGGPRRVAVLTTAGDPTSVRGSWSALGGDSVSIALRRIGYSGSIVLGPSDGVRAGVAVSSPATALEQVVVAEGAAAQPRSRADGAPAESRKASAPSAAAPPPRAAPQTAVQSGPPVRQLRVTARTIACPAR
jgi:hypothetical protein